MMLLTLIVFVVDILRSFFTQERTRKYLAGRRASAGNVMAAFFAIVTLFCSCSAVPLFLGFVQAGVPLGVTFSFLIAAPMVNEIVVILLYGLLGWVPDTDQLGYHCLIVDKQYSFLLICPSQFTLVHIFLLVPSVLIAKQKKLFLWVQLAPARHHHHAGRQSL